MATIGKLFLALACAKLVLAQVYPDSRGVEFVVGYMANYVLKSPVQLFVTTSKTEQVTVTVTAPMFPQAGLNEVFNVTAGEVKQLFIDNSIRAAGTGKESKGILVSATEEIVVYGTNVEKYSNDAFLGFPVDVLGNSYYAVSHYPTDYEGEILVVGVYDSTNVTITLGTHSEINVKYNRNRYYSNDVIEVSLNRLDTFQIQTYGDLTGSHVFADRDVVVYSGNKMTSVKGTSRDHLVDQMLPVQTWGKTFGTVPIPDRLIVKPGDEVKFIASEDDTSVEVICSGGYSLSFNLDEREFAEYLLPSDECCCIRSNKSIMVILIVLSQLSADEPADPSLITIPPVEQYAAEYTLATPKYSKGLYQNFAIFIVEESLKDGLLIDGLPVPSGTSYTPIPGTSFVGAHVEVSDGTHNFRHETSSVFGLFMYGTAKWETYGMPGGLSLAHINGWCDLSFTPVDGDGIDNDCDDLIDEEICSPENNGTDDDGDGLIDEDCALPPPIDGNWTVWSNWSVCSIPCTPYNGNVTNGTAIRTRNCSNPEPQYGGFMCIGADVENTTCMETSICPVHGNWSSWGSWSSCSTPCGNGTYSRSRTCTDPVPDYGGDNCTGSGNETGICDTGVNCPVDGAWGSWTSWGSCSVTCGDLGSTAIRSRLCDSPAAAYGGKNCSGEYEETSTCNTLSCPIDGNWTVWSAWSSCGVTCGNSTVFRNRSCTNPEPKYNGTDCVGSEYEVTSCYAGIMCPIDGGFSDWTTWDACTVVCGGGTKNRTRSCNNPEPLYLGAPCIGHTNEQQICNTHLCRVDGGWTDWSVWGPCSNVCGPGNMTRDRSCTNPVPQNNGTDCTGVDTETVICTGPCSVDGGWGSWDPWAACSHTCGGGRRARVRICDNPVPTPDGSPCFGEAIQFEVCNSRPCTGSVSWASDGQYISVCPERFFACKAGGMMCVEQDFRCDCMPDCDDGSDESVDWGGCSVDLHTYCGRNIADGTQSTFGFNLFVFVVLNISNWVT